MHIATDQAPRDDQRRGNTIDQRLLRLYMGATTPPSVRAQAPRRYRAA